MSSNRRQFMRKMGAAGATLGATSIAGCSGTGSSTGSNDNGDDGKVREENLPAERKVQAVDHVSNTERYWAERYQASALVDKWFTDKLGAPVNIAPEEISVLVTREQEGDYGLVTYNWCADGDPDGILVERFHKTGSLSLQGFDNEKYNELSLAQRRETDQKKRQELVHECQKILGEQRVENQYLYNVYPYAYNNTRFEEDSIVVTTKGLRNIWNYTQIQPKNDDGKTIITNNWDPSDQLNPLHINGVGPDRNWTPLTYMHDFLVRLDESQKPTPWAAKEYNWSDDTTLNVTLKDGMAFHDGEPVTADDVVYTFDLILDTEAPAYQNTVIQTVDSVEKTGDLSVTFNLVEPHAPFLSLTLAQTPILPKHYWEQLLSDTGNENTPWQVVIDESNPIVGSGPFSWGSWDQGSKFEMKAFKDHAFAAPNIDAKIQRPLSTRSAEIEALKNGDYDLLDYWVGSPSKLKEEVEATDHLSLVETSDDCRQAAWVNTEKAPFDDVAFRQAANAMIMEAQNVIIEEIYDGFGNRAISPINSTMEFWHNEDSPWFEGGVEGATTILKDAGYVWDGDGNLYYPEDEASS